MILTTRGEVAVEALVVGDRLVTSTGLAQPGRWIGRRSYDCRTYIKPSSILPIRITAEAIAPGVPSRDTCVSDGHALFFPDEGGMLIAAHELVNGTTIAPVSAQHVTYWHVELNRHDVILANSFFVESYEDCGTRGLFEAVTIVPEGAGPPPSSLRRVGGENADAVRRRLAAGGSWPRPGRDRAGACRLASVR